MLTKKKSLKLLLVLFFNSRKMSTPFQTMKAVYVYIAALIGLVVLASGASLLVEYFLSVLFLGAGFDAAYLITPLTRIITGLFIMIPHWGIGHHFHLLERGKRK